MRSLIVRFHQAEGAGIWLDLLQEKGYQINYHNAYEKGLGLLPNAHQVYDLIFLMGGPQSVADDSNQKFFKPYYDLVRDSLANPKSKLIGTCLGSQIIAKAMGGEVSRGEKGKEAGFGKLRIEKPDHPIFQDLPSKDSLVGFHLHEDVFTLPKGADLLVSSDTYPNQMFSIQDKLFGFQVHLEPSMQMLQAWSVVHKGFLEDAGVRMDTTWTGEQKKMEESSRKIFRRIMEL